MAQDDTTRNGIQVIARAAKILRVLRDSQDGMSLGQISEAVDLPRSTVQRIGRGLAEGTLCYRVSPRRRLAHRPRDAKLCRSRALQYC